MVFEQKVAVTADLVDCFGRCKASTLLYFAQEAAGDHCRLLRLDCDALAEKNLFWAVIRTHVKVNQLPMLGQNLTVKTWPLPTTRTAFPRAVVLCDEAGKELVHILSLWVLMDKTSRAMVLPGKSGVEVNGLLTGNELAAPGSILPRVGENTQLRTVRFSELDRNGHMNNTRYLDWTADLLTASFHKDHPVKEFTVCYLSEAVENQQIELTYGMENAGVFQVDGADTRTDEAGKKTRVFSVKAQF